jgi:RNA polymerase sigma-70 factor (ECF subfamily)
MDDRGAQVPDLETLFRHQAAKLVAALLRVLGVERIDAAEDLVQDTLIVALQSWQSGMPQDPSAWLFAVARNRARDLLRKERVRGGGVDHAVELAELAAPEPEQEDEDLLRVMFSCCHPELTLESQSALILRLVCGFGPREVAHMFLADEGAMEKRLFRAKRVLADEGALFEVSDPDEARARLPAVLDALYLMFDAGYHGSVVPEVVRADVCADAIRLSSLLADARSTTSPEVHALVALMCLHAARLPGRLDRDGALRPLEQQDRGRWDQDLIERGVAHLAASGAGSAISAHHLEAGIAAHHALSPSLGETPWPAIVALYELLYARKRTPVVALNLAIARSMVGSPRAGIEEIQAIDGRDKLLGYPFYWAALVDLALRAGDREAASAWIRAGVGASRNEAERSMFLRRATEAAEDPTTA